jgi:hypothetical protein
MARHLPLRFAIFVGGVLFMPGVATASNWANPLNQGSHGEGHTQALPAAPSGVSAACTSLTGKTIKVTWNAVTHASGYSIYQSTVSASSGYGLVASGITGTSWTSGTLSNATYWFEVAAKIGTNWASPNSTATGSHIIATAGCT